MINEKEANVILRKGITQEVDPTVPAVVSDLSDVAGELYYKGSPVGGGGGTEIDPDVLAVINELSDVSDELYYKGQPVNQGGGGGSVELGNVSIEKAGETIASYASLTAALVDYNDISNQKIVLHTNLGAADDFLTISKSAIIDANGFDMNVFIDISGSNTNLKIYNINNIGFVSISTTIAGLYIKAKACGEVINPNIFFAGFNINSGISKNGTVIIEIDKVVDQGIGGNAIFLAGDFSLICENFNFYIKELTILGNAILSFNDVGTNMSFLKKANIRIDFIYIESTNAQIIAQYWLVKNKPTIFHRTATEIRFQGVGAEDIANPRDISINYISENAGAVLFFSSWNSIKDSTFFVTNPIIIIEDVQIENTKVISSATTSFRNFIAPSVIDTRVLGSVISNKPFDASVNPLIGTPIVNADIK